MSGAIIIGKQGFGVTGGVPDGANMGLSTTADMINGSVYGLVPDTGLDITANLQAALTVGRLTGKPVRVMPGQYIWKKKITYAGGGLVCTDGYACFDNQDPAYSDIVLDFQSTDASVLNGVEIANIKFTCSTRPDTGLSNGANEYAHFVRVTKARNVRVWGNRFSHNYGGAVLFRDVEDSSLIGNEVDDVWKDAFHATDGCRNIIRGYNIVRGGGDDAFAVVGSITKGIMPIGITDIGNRVYGVRKARGFSYVGCKEIDNIGCFVDGKIPPHIPQQGDVAGGRYNTACALYIAAEAGYNTYGCENVRVRGFVAENIAPGIDSVGAATSTLQAIHISAGNGAGSPLKNISVHATLRNGATRALFCVGNGYTQDIDADIILENNFDPLGLLSLTYTPGSAGANKNAAEFQSTRNVKLKLRANNVAAGAVYMDAACSGIADLDVSVGAMSQSAVSSPIQIASSSQLEAVDIKLNFEATPASSGAGSINRIVDMGTNQGIVRSCRVTGVNHATAAANVLSGWPARSLTLGASPSTVVNTTGRPMLFYSRLGTVSAVARTGVKGRALAKVVATGANGTVQIDGDFTDIYTAAAVVTLFNARGVAIGTGTVASSALAGGVTTVTFDATGVNASFAAGMQMAVANTMRTIPSRTNGVFELPPETAIQVTYSAAPTCTISDQAF